MKKETKEIIVRNDIIINTKDVRIKKVIQAGDTVRIKGTKELAKVNRLVSDFGGDIAILDKPVRGFSYWNIKELIKK